MKTGGYRTCSILGVSWCAWGAARALVVGSGGLGWGSVSLGARRAPAPPLLSLSSRSSSSSSFGEDGGGVKLPGREEAEAYATFLARAIREHLDTEWLPQECHGQIGEEVANIFRRTVLDEGSQDLADVIMAVGSGLEQFDMGDAFVGGWDVANLCSDFLFDRMGLETAACCSKPPPMGVADEDGIGVTKSAGSAVASGLKTTVAEARSICRHLNHEFDRFRWLSQVLDDEVDWRELSIVAAVARGQLTGAEDGNDGADNFRVEVPHLERDCAALRAMDEDIPDTLDMEEGMQDFIEALHGKEATNLDSSGTNPNFDRRCRIVKWLYHDGFLEEFPPRDSVFA